MAMEEELENVRYKTEFDEVDAFDLRLKELEGRVKSKEEEGEMYKKLYYQTLEEYKQGVSFFLYLVTGG